MQAARDFANNHGALNEDRRNNFLLDFDQPCHDAKDDDVDLVSLLQRLKKTIDMADPAHGAAIQRDGLELFTNLCAASEQIRKRDDKANHKGWKDWVGDSDDKGHKQAHWYARIPTAWVSEEARDTDGVATGDPAALLEGQRAKFKDLW